MVNKCKECENFNPRIATGTEWKMYGVHLMYHEPTTTEVMGTHTLSPENLKGWEGIYKYLNDLGFTTQQQGIVVGILTDIENQIREEKRVHNHTEPELQNHDSGYNQAIDKSIEIIKSYRK